MFAHKIFSRFQASKAIIIFTENVVPSKRYLGQVSAFSRPAVLKHIVFIPKRNISFQSLRKPNIEKLKLKDNIPKQYDLIYRCTMSSYLYAAQMSAIIGTIVITIVTLVNYDSTSEYQINLTDVNLYNIVQSQHQLAIFLFGFMLLNMAVIILVNKFPVRIYFDAKTKKYLGIIHGKIPQTKNTFAFNAGEVKHTPRSGVLPWTEYYFKLNNGKTIILLDQYFRKPDDMNIMLGYTKL